MVFDSFRFQTENRVGNWLGIFNIDTKLEIGLRYYLAGLAHHNNVLFLWNNNCKHA